MAANSVSPDPGYFSDITNITPPSEHKSNPKEEPLDDNKQSYPPKRFLNPEAVKMMETWYRDNFYHPYPSAEVIAVIVTLGHITTSQVKKWMANKRVRSYNTLSYNGTIHPKRLNRLRKEYAENKLHSGRYSPYVQRPFASPLHVNIPLEANRSATDSGLLTMRTFPAFRPILGLQGHFMPLCLLPNLNNVSEK